MRRPQILLGWLRAYAAATATTTTWEEIRQAATPGENPPAATTARPYIELLTGLRVLDPVPAWLPTHNHLRTLNNGAKHHLVDPALALRLLNLTPQQLLDGTEPELAIVRDGTFLAIETKLASTIEDRDLRHLQWLRETLPGHNVSLAVITSGPEAYTRTDDIHIIPLALVGP